MKTLTHIIRAVAILGLILIFIVSVIYAGGSITLETYKILLLVLSILWFAGILSSNQIQIWYNSNQSDK